MAGTFTRFRFGRGINNRLRFGEPSDNVAQLSKLIANVREAIYQMNKDLGIKISPTNNEKNWSWACTFPAIDDSKPPEVSPTHRQRRPLGFRLAKAEPKRGRSQNVPAVHQKPQRNPIP